MYKVSAIVSTYKSERFIRGCLDDLTSQTLYRAGALEIIVVVSGSPEGESAVVRSYQQKHPAIVLVETERETMYGAWNRGVVAARGEYLTNANTDDRHRLDTLEILAKYLDSNQKIDLVYSNCFVSRQENETFEQCPKDVTYFYPRFFAPNAALHYQLGPHPMWRRSIHQKIGLFASRLKAAGDFDFNLRFARSLRAQRVDGPPLGLYLAHAGAISFKDDTMSRETSNLYTEARSLASLEALYAIEGFNITNAAARAQMLVDFGLRALQYFPPWFEGRPHCDAVLAEEIFLRALEQQPLFSAAHVGYLAALIVRGEREKASKHLIEAEKEGVKGEYIERMKSTLRNASQLESAQVVLEPSGLSFPTQSELTFAGAERGS